MKSILNLTIPALLLMTAATSICQASGHGDGGATPFTASGDAIQAIFQDAAIWKKVAGSVQSIKLLGQKAGASQFAVSTIEYIPIVDSSGVTTGYTPTPCTFTVDVTYGGDGSGFGVTSIDYSGCPHTRF